MHPRSAAITWIIWNIFIIYRDMIKLYLRKLCGLRRPWRILELFPIESVCVIYIIYFCSYKIFLSKSVKIIISNFFLSIQNTENIQGNWNERDCIYSLLLPRYLQHTHWKSQNINTIVHKSSDTYVVNVVQDWIHFAKYCRS